MSTSTEIKHDMRLEILRSSIESRKKWYQQKRAELRSSENHQFTANISIISVYIEQCDELLRDIEKMSPVVNPIKKLLE